MRISEFTETPFISYDDKVMIRIRVADWDHCNPFQVSITSDGNEIYSGQMFKETFSVLVPLPKTDTECYVKLTPFSDMPSVSIHPLYVPKCWRIGIVYSSHEDIGYCAYANRLEYESYVFLKEAMRLCIEHSDFRYMIEHVWWLNGFERYATPNECATLQRLFDEKKIELNSIYCGYHTHWATGEQLIRSMEFATHDAAKRWNIRPTSAIFTDISGMTEEVISAYSGQGIRYVGILENGGFRKPNIAQNPPPIFKWRSHNGKDSLICWYQNQYKGGVLGNIWCDTNRQYPEGTYGFDETKALKTENAFTDILRPLEKTAYSVYPMSFYDDRETPTTMLLTVCEYMNKKWKYPHFSLETPSAMFDEIASVSGDTLPELSGDMNDQWGDFATISPEWMSKKRKAMRRLFPGEMLATFSALSGKEYDFSAFSDIIKQGSLFDEHCWATSSKHPQKMHLFNMEYIKKRSAEKALETVNEMIRDAVGVPNEKIGLYNLLPRKRCHPLLFESVALPKGISLQKVGDRVISSPIEFEPFEVKTFENGAEPTAARIVSVDWFETEFYTVKIDNETHTVTSITEKSTNRELVDHNSQYTFGEYIYCTAYDKNDPRLSFEIPKRRKFRIEDGEVAFVIHKEGYEEQSGADVCTDIVFYKNHRQIDIDLRFEYAVGLMGDHSDRYRKNIFFAFPFKVENHKFFTELSSGNAHDIKENMLICPQDFTVVEDWLAIQGENGGIGIYSEDMPVLHLSQINYNKFMTEQNFPHSHVYLYAASNRTNNLNFRTPEDCRGRYRLSIIPYDGSCDRVLPELMEELSQPIITGDGRSTAAVYSDSKLRLMSMRVFDSHSILFRFKELYGEKNERVKLTLPFESTAAFYATLDGRELSKAEIYQNNVIFSALPHSYVTLKICGNFDITPKSRKTSQIYNIFTVNIENKRSIVCFEKSDDLEAKGFRVKGDGKVLAEVQNQPERVQICELDIRCENIEIEPI